MPCRRHCRSCVDETPYCLATVVGEMRAKTIPFAILCRVPFGTLAETWPVKELASRSGRTVEYRSGARICRESRLRRLAKEGQGSSLTQPKRNDAVVVNKSDAKRPAGQSPTTTKAP